MEPYTFEWSEKLIGTMFADRRAGVRMRRTAARGQVCGQEIMVIGYDRWGRRKSSSVTWGWKNALRLARAASVKGGVVKVADAMAVKLSRKAIR